MRSEQRNTLTKLPPTYWEETVGDIYRFICECTKTTVFAFPLDETEIEFSCVGCGKDLKLVNTERAYQ